MKNDFIKNLPEPLMWDVLEKGEVDKTTDPLTYLEVRTAIQKGLGKLKRSNKVKFIGGATGMMEDKDGTTIGTDFIMSFEFKGRTICMKGMIAE
jgi:hypothetical protein